MTRCKKGTLHTHAVTNYDAARAKAIELGRALSLEEMASVQAWYVSLDSRGKIQTVAAEASMEAAAAFVRGWLAAEKQS